MGCPKARLLEVAHSLENMYAAPRLTYIHENKQSLVEYQEARPSQAAHSMSNTYVAPSLTEGTGLRTKCPKGLDHEVAIPGSSTIAGRP